MPTLVPPPKIQFFDANGNPLVGGKLYTYASGTTTPLATYTNWGALTPNSNPVILNSRGEASVWLANASYTLYLTSAADVAIWSVDHIDGDTSAAILAALAAPGGSALVGFLQAGTGAVARTAQNKMRDIVSVKDYGAVGDGDIDDRTAFVRAYTYAYSIGAAVYAPPGYYYISSAFSIYEVPLIYSRGVIFTQFKPPGDAGNIYGEALVAYQASVQKAGFISQSGSANETGLYVGLVSATSGALSNYQKNAIFARIVQADPSTTLAYHDGVGIEGQGIIPATNALGRVWGVHGLAYVTSGGDGSAYGAEFEVYNFGSDQPLVDTYTSKYGLHVVAGAHLTTAGIKLTAADAGNISNPNRGSFTYGIYSDPEAFPQGYFIALRDRMSFNENGHLTIGAMFPYDTETLTTNWSSGTYGKSMMVNTNSGGCTYWGFVYKNETTPANSKVYSVGIQNTAGEFRITNLDDGAMNTNINFSILDNVGIGLFGSAATHLANGTKVVYLANCTAAPSGTPFGGGILYAEAGALKWKGSSGTVTSIASA